MAFYSLLALSVTVSLYHIYPFKPCPAIHSPEVPQLLIVICVLCCDELHSTHVTTNTERDVNINVIKMWGKKHMHPISYICIMCSIYVNLPLVFYMFSLFHFFFFYLLNVLSYLSFSLEICSLLDEKYDLRKMRHFQYFQEGPDPCVSSSLCQKVVWRSRKR